MKRYPSFILLPSTKSLSCEVSTNSTRVTLPRRYSTSPLMTSRISPPVIREGDETREENLEVYSYCFDKVSETQKENNKLRLIEYYSLEARDIRLYLFGTLVFATLTIFLRHRLMYYFMGSHECSLRFNNIPTSLTESNIWSADFQRQEKSKHLTFQAVYNPSIAFMSGSKFLFTARLSWNYDTDCGKFQKSSMAEYYCLLAYSNRWQDTSLLGVYDDATCTANIHTNDIFDDINEEWINGSNWYDTKLLSLNAGLEPVLNSDFTTNFKSTYSVNNDEGKKLSFPGLWMTSQRTEVIESTDAVAKDMVLILQMMYLTYYRSSSSSWTGMTRAVYFDSNRSHWTAPKTNKHLGEHEFPIYDIVHHLCEQRASQLPQLPPPEIPIFNSIVMRIPPRKLPPHKRKKPMPNLKNLTYSIPDSLNNFKQLGKNQSIIAKIQRINFISDTNISAKSSSSNRMVENKRHHKAKRRLTNLSHGLKGTIKDKNWTPFVTQGDNILWSYSIYPHIVCENDLDIRKVETDCVICHRKFSTKNEELFNPHIEMLKKTYIGNFLGEGKLPVYQTNVDYHLNGVVAYKIVNEDHYVGIAHAKVSYWTNDIKNKHENFFLSYIHFFYKMSPRPPYDIFALSRPINLSTGESFAVWFSPTETVDVAFVSGFEYLPEEMGNELVIAYGCADRDSKILRMGVRQMDRYFMH